MAKQVCRKRKTRPERDLEDLQTRCQVTVCLAIAALREALELHMKRLTEVTDAIAAVRKESPEFLNSVFDK